MSLQPPTSAPRLRRFRVDVGTIISAVVLVQSLLLVALGYWGAQRLVSTIGESAHHADHARIEDKTIAYLAKAASVVEAIGDSPSLQVSGEGKAQTAELLWTLLQQSPELDSLYAANTDGDMMMARRHPAPAVRHVTVAPEGSTETWQYKPMAGGQAVRSCATAPSASRRSAPPTTHANGSGSRARWAATGLPCGPRPTCTPR